MPQIYACYQVYNRAKLMPYSLNSIIPYVDKVVVVDGIWSQTAHIEEHAESTDGTKEICQKICGNKLIWIDCPKNENGKYIPWVGENIQRNACFNVVPENTWVIMLATDEVVTGSVKEFTDNLRTHNDWNGLTAFMLKMLNFFPVLMEWKTLEPSTGQAIKQVLELPQDFEDAKLTSWDYQGDYDLSKNLTQVNWIGYYGPVSRVVFKQKGMRFYSDGAICIGNAIVKIPRRPVYPDILLIHQRFLCSFKEHMRRAEYCEYVLENPHMDTPQNPQNSKPIPMKALMCIISVRDIPEIKKKFDLITCVDKVFFKYLPLKENLEQVEDYFLSHPEYTHLILNSDDGVPSNEQIAMLIADIKKYDFPVISGCCCMDKLTNDMRLNITVDAVSNATSILDYRKLDYQLLPYDFANLNSMIKVWFQGAAACCIRRDIVKDVGLVYPEYYDNEREWLKYGDLAFSLKCATLGIPQYVDLRCYFEHYKYDTHKGVGKLYNNGEKKPEIIFEKAKSEVPKTEPAPIGFSDIERKPRIFIGIPVCNEGLSIERCINSILNLDYPKELIDVLFLENNSSDNSWEIIQKYVKFAKSNCNYHSFEAVQDWGKYGETPVYKHEGGWLTTDRAEHLCHIMNRILDETITHNCDFSVLFMADVIAHPDILNQYLKVFECKSDAGWAGGVLHKRHPHYAMNPVTGPNPINYGLHSPTFKYRTGDSIPQNYNKEWVLTIEKLNSPMFSNGKYPYSYGIRGPTENEILDTIEQMRPNLPIVEVCCTGHIVMIRKEICDLRFKVAAVETGLQFETEMGERGYKMYAHLGVYITHISSDGKIYRTGLTRQPEISSSSFGTHTDAIKKQQQKSALNEGRQGPHP